MKKLVLFLSLLFVAVTSASAQYVPMAFNTGTPPFTPTSIAGLQFWFAGNCITFPSSVCAFPSNGTSITTWADQSGNANNLALLGGTCVLDTNQLNGLPAVDFGTTCRWNLATPIAATSGHTVFAVYNTSASSGGAGTILGTSTLGGFAYNLAGPTSAQSVDRQNSANVGSATNHVTTGTFVQSNAVMQNLSPSFIMNFRMTQATDTTSSSTASNITTTGPSCVGADCFGGVSQLFNGKLVELLYWNVTLTLPQIQQVEAYLHTKYGV